VTKPSIPETKNRYAICVGINQYAASAQVFDLRYAEQDAQALYTLLLQHGFEKANSRLLLGSEATLDAIYQALEEFVLTKPDRDDLVLFFFAGHGVPLCIDEGQKSKDARCEVFLTSYDFDRYKVMDRGAWLAYRLRMGYLRKGIFEETLSEKVLFLFDCCYGGDFHRSTYQDRSGEQLASRYITQPFAHSSAGHIVVSSCLPHQKSREDERLQHGVFTYHLLEALEGRIPEAIRPTGWITVGSLFDSLSEKLPESQRPVKSGVELDTFKLLCYPGCTTIVPVTSTSSPSHIQSEKESQLKMMIADHRAFMHNRLSSFVGRVQELEALRQRIEAIQQTGGYVTITGQAGQGKSSIIAKLVEEYGPEQVAHHFIPFNPGPDHQVGLLRNLMARLICKYNLSEIYVASDSRPALRDYFPKVLREIVEKGGQEIIFIDGLDQLEEDQTGGRDLSFLPNNPPQGIVFVLGTRPNDTLKPLELLKPCHEYPLPNLSRSDFDLILLHRHVHLERGLADRFYEAMEQNALYLDLVAKELLEAREMSLEDIIHRISRDPDYLFTLAIERLKRGDKTLWKEVVYPTLGLLLTSCEPLSRKQIGQLLGVEDYRCRDGMMKLGGLVTEDGQQHYSLFHLKFRDYLHQDECHPTKDYLFAIHEEQQWHTVLAGWCNQGGIQTIWQDVKLGSAEQERRVYARKHYIVHLYHSRAWDRLFEVLDVQEYGKAKNRVYDPSTKSYVQDLDLGRRAAAWDGWTLEEGIVYLPYLWRYTLLQCSLTSRADQYPINVFRLLVQLKRIPEAIGLAELLTDLISRVRVLLEIVKQMEEQAEPQTERLKILLRVCEIVSVMKKSNELRKRTEQIEVLRRLASALIQAEQWREAKQVIGTVQDDKEQTKALWELARTLMQAQQWENAKEVIASIQDSEEQTEGLRELGKALMQAQQWER
jgi:hypothetical protein